MVNIMRLDIGLPFHLKFFYGKLDHSFFEMFFGDLVTWSFRNDFSIEFNPISL